MAEAMQGLRQLADVLNIETARISGDPQRLQLALGESQSRKLQEADNLINAEIDKLNIPDTQKALLKALSPKEKYDAIYAKDISRGYKPELVNYKNVIEEDIQIGNFIIKPGESVPFNVSIPEIANAISGTKGLEEVKDRTVYTRQGSLYMTEDGDYREIIRGDKRIFSGPMGEYDPGAFFAKYPESRSKTSGEEQRYIPDFKTFVGLNKDLATEERSLNKILSYWENIKDTNIGVERLGDQISTWFKTLAGRYDLTPQELARGIAEGKLQGLIGANRIDTVGGGVMTEKDAWRIIARLGGDVDALQNPAVVGPLLEEMYRDKVTQYNQDIKGYNIGVDSQKFSGYEKRTPITTEEVTELFTILPKGVPVGAKKVNVNGITLYQKDDKYYGIDPVSSSVVEVEIDL